MVLATLATFFGLKVVRDSIKHDLKLAFLFMSTLFTWTETNIKGEKFALSILADCIFTFDDIRPPSIVEPVAVEKLLSSAVLKNIIYNKQTVWFSFKF